MADALNPTADTLLQCVSDALSDDLRPVCTTYLTVGSPVIARCCECDDITGANGELSIHLMRMFDVDSRTLEEIRRVRPCRGGTTAAQFRLVLARCVPTINEHGEIPSPDMFEEKAVEQARDIEVVWQALTCCTDYQMSIDDLTVDLGPMGGCSVFWVDLTVLVQVPALDTGSA